MTKVKPMSKSNILKDSITGGLVAAGLMGGVVLAECTQIDAATKIASYYQRYQEIRQQILNLENWYNETVSTLQGVVPALNDRLDEISNEIAGEAEGYIESATGIHPRAVANSSSEELVTYAGRNVLGGNDPCVAAAMGLGRDVPSAERAVSDCADLSTRMVIPYGHGVAPNSAISLNGMLSISDGQWPAYNAIREDLNWFGEVRQSGGVGALLQASSVASLPGSTADNVAKQMRLGDLIVGRGITSIESREALSASPGAVLAANQQASAGRNSYAIEAIAREASVRPTLDMIRDQLGNIDIHSIDEMTEAQRYATRLSAAATKETLKGLLNESRLRQEQLEGILLTISQDADIRAMGVYQ